MYYEPRGRGARTFARVVLIFSLFGPLLSWLMLRQVMGLGGWVGAGVENVPPAARVVLVPSLLSALGGMLATLAGLFGRRVGVILEGLVAVVLGAVGYLAFGLVIKAAAMGAIHG